MRPSAVFLVLIVVLSLADAALFRHRQARSTQRQKEAATLRIVVSALGLTDLSLATEARYTRHPAIADMVVPFMDHPGAIEHFPSGSFWAVANAGR